MTLPDAAIVRQVLGGNTEAFSELVHRYHDRCTRLALHIVGNPDDAADAVQEAFLRAYRHLGSYQERDKFSAWMLRILVNQCRTGLTRSRKHDTALPLSEHDAMALSTSGVAVTDHAALRDELAAALSQLVPDQREALVLRFSDDLTFDEMAAVTGVGVSALKMRVQRACQRMRALLTEASHV
jgi:RNA polymerase sigma-70 factor (ECF subfamily)